MKHLPMPHMTQNDIDRFWSKVRVASPDECWLWSAGTCSGYGHFSVGNKTYKASRISVFLRDGRDPGGKQVCHKCDNPSCVNPHHLWLGTAKENNRDKTIKGRQARETRHGRAVLDVQDVIAIKSSPKNTVELAREYGVKNNTIGRIQRGLLWPRIAPDLTRESKRPGLSLQTAQTIRESPQPGRVPAKRFRISEAMVSRIRHGKAWNDGKRATRNMQNAL